MIKLAGVLAASMMLVSCDQQHTPSAQSSNIFGSDGSSDIPMAIVTWHKANENCWSVIGGDSCRIRDELGKKLTEAGYCFDGDSVPREKRIWHACGAATQESNRSASSAPENFLVGLCEMPELSPLENCTSEELLGVGEVSSFSIYRDNFVETHLAIGNLNEDGLDGTFREEVFTTPVSYQVSSDGSEVRISFRNGDCQIENVFRKSGDTITKTHGRYSGKCDSLQNLNQLAGNDGSEKLIRYTTGN